MALMDDILRKMDMKFEDLTSAERDTLLEWTSVLDSNQLNVEAVRRYVHSLRETVQNELATLKEAPSNWVGILALFIPFYGLIKKWYADQYRISLEARLRNLTLLESFLVGPQKAREALDRAIAGIVTNRKH